MTILVTLLAVVIALLAVLVAGLLRSHAEILRALHELGVGLDPDERSSRERVPSSSTPLRRESRGAADIVGVAPNGDAVAVGVVGAEHPTLVAFLTTGCTTCADFWSAFSDADRLRVPGDARVVVVTKGEEAESAVRLRKFAAAVPVVMSSEAWEAYDVPVAPYFAFVDGPSGRVIGEGASNTWEQLSSMLGRALEEAGVDLSPGGGRRRRPASNADRADRIDRDLRSAGIEPGDPSLYPRTEADLHGGA